MKVIEIRSCGECPWFRPNPPHKTNCGNPKIVFKRPYASDRQTEKTDLPTWCPLEDKHE